ncbi:hypothetical protein Trydic_g6617 [Trypoxylus dichotomus]
MAIKMKDEEQYFNVTLPTSERHKRLLPYMNFYLRQPFNQPYHQQVQQQSSNQNRYRALVRKPNPLQPLLKKFNELMRINIQPPPVRQDQQGKTTPFTETNALPGPFVPMKSNQQYRQSPQPNFSEIYEKLLQLKYSQPAQYHFQQPIFNHLGGHPPKAIVQTYTPTEVDIPPPPPVQYDQTYQQQNYHDNIENQKVVYQQEPAQRLPIHIVHLVDSPVQKHQDFRQGFVEKPVIILRQKQPSSQPLFQDVQQQTTDERQRIFEEQLRIYEDQHQAFRNEQKFLEEQEQRRLADEERRKYAEHAQKYLIYAPHIPQRSQYVSIQEYHQPIAGKYQQIAPTVTQEHPSVAFASDPKENENLHSTTEVILTTNRYPNHQYPVTENANDLGEILKKLQASNTLPQNLTPENIDNSIKTLVKILNMLKKRQRLSKKPIVVPDQDASLNNVSGVEFGDQQNIDALPETVIQTFPSDTVEGGTPGKPGIDYPALSSIPHTSFSCKTQRYKGFFGDPDTNCQVWHYCDFNGGQASFLCPNGTIFSQVALTCDWWYNVKCSSTPQLYVLNERLYKYILPFSPKFPEDYSGPLVDKYLALKFQEMEEKMKKQRKKPKESNGQSNKNKEDDKESTENQEKDEEAEIDDADQLQKQNEENRRNSSSYGVEIEGNNVRRSAT